MENHEISWEITVNNKTNYENNENNNKNKNKNKNKEIYFLLASQKNIKMIKHGKSLNNYVNNHEK